MTMKSITDDILSGKNQLWLILDGEEFRSFVLTEIKVAIEDGRKSVMVAQLAGEGGTAVTPLIAEIEAWARSIGAVEMNFLGRIGWRKALAKEGYGVELCIYRKEFAK
jgi:hypothetical protein